MLRRFPALLLLGLVGLPPAAVAEGPALEGTWKLVVLAFGEDEFAVVDIKPGDEGLTAEVVAAQAFLGEPSVTRVEREDGRVLLALDTASGASTFTGRAPDGDGEGPILGTFFFRETVYPARLEPTGDREVAALSGGLLLRELSAIRRVADPRERYRRLADLLERSPASPTLAHVYSQMLQDAEAAGLAADEVQALLDRWHVEAEPYGPAWVAETQTSALKALAGKKPYARNTLELAQRADRELGADASIAQRAAIVEQLARAANLAGDRAAAREARERSAVLQGQLDEEYRRKVPPFEPDAFAGRKDPQNDRVVLMELFTGAQCPPCVAADVAFDALLETYEPTELIGLQYHLHIPGPDPLTNPDSLARADYYGINSTPSTVFNGEAEAPGGGGMGAAEAKYRQYRQVIESRLEARARATIDLTATRRRDVISIVVKANAEAGGAGEAAGGRPDLRLRLALVEESIRFVGGNGLRFHHQVVRALPGGPDGFAMADGACEQQLDVDLGGLRREIESYLSDYARARAFPQPPPPIELKGLRVVAFVQDNADKSVWHAVVAAPEQTEGE